jgi:hypothetical protein
VRHRGGVERQAGRRDAPRIGGGARRRLAAIHPAEERADRPGDPRRFLEDHEVALGADEDLGLGHEARVLARGGDRHERVVLAVKDQHRARPAGQDPRSGRWSVS